MTVLNSADEVPAAPLPSVRRVLVATTCAFLLVAPFSGSAGWRAASLLLAAAALAFDREEGASRLRAAPRGFVLAWIAWALLAIASVGWSERPAYSATELRAELLYGTLALGVFFAAGSSAARLRTWWCVLMAGSALAFAAPLLEHLLGMRFSRHDLDGGPGPWSTHLVLVAPLFAALAWTGPWSARRRPLALAAAIGLLVFSAWTTGNRIVWVALAVELGTVALLHGALAPSRVGRGRSIVVLVSLAAVLVAVALPASIIERSERYFPGRSGVTQLQHDARPVLWAAAWDKFRERPLLGHGFGREILESTFLAHTPSDQPEPTLQHAHNTFIDIALETGLAGAAIFVALLLALSRVHLRLLRDATLAPLGIMGLSVIAGYVVKNLTDDFFHRHNALLFWAIQAALAGYGLRALQRRGESGV
ncbi:MAG TPA: O-antigen ligase family protein [Usitatibacter sp.]|nr:O-antigen ligase family protein [Usitatibacter sp.]